MPQPLLQSLEPRLLLAAPGLDSTFGGDGQIYFDAQPQGALHSVVPLADGGLIVTGTRWQGRRWQGRPNLEITRLLPDGTPDGSFGDRGAASTRIPVPKGVRAALQGDARLVVVNTASWRIYRFTTAGQRDPKFKSTRTDFRGVGETAMALAMQNNGRIVVAGRAGGYLALTRYSPNGKPDRSFDFDGRVMTDIAVTDLNAADLAIDSAGRILVRAGDRLYRFKPNGRLDRAFASDARFGGIDAFALDRQGRLVTASADRIHRFTSRGDLDPTFNRGGALRVALDYRPTALFIRPSGDIEIFGHDKIRWNKGLTARILRLGDDGVKLGGGSIRVPEFYDIPDNSVHATIDPRGRIVVSGRYLDQVFRLMADPFSQSAHSRTTDVMVFQAEDYDEGGPEVAYHDLDRPNLNNQRGGYVRIVSAAGHASITDTRPGEWLEYTYNLREPTDSDILFRLSSREGGGSFHLELDGDDVTGPLIVPRTGDDPSIQADVLSPVVHFPSGKHVLRLVMDSAGPSGVVADFDLFTLSHGLIDAAYGGFGWAPVAPGKLIGRPDGAVLVVHSSDGFTLLDAQGQVVASRPSNVGSDVDQVLLQPDWKFLVRTGPTLYRYNGDLTLDQTFAQGGMLAIADEAVALQPDGKIVAGAQRYLPDGERDPQFAVRLDQAQLPQRPGRHDISPWRLIGASGQGKLYYAMESRGSMIRFGGRGGLRAFPSYLDIARFEEDGQLDPAYGTSGVMEVILQSNWIDHQDRPRRFFDLTVAPSGAVAVGIEVETTRGHVQSDVVIAPADGQAVQYASPRYSSATFLADGLAISPDGQWLLRGTASAQSRYDPLLEEQFPSLIGGPWTKYDWNGIFSRQVIRDVAFQENGQPLIATDLGLRRGTAFGVPTAAFNSRPWAPGDMVQAEDFDIGGQGLGNLDVSPANEGGAYRTSTADIEQVGGRFAVTHALPGEWLGYTYRFPISTAYSMELLVASAGPGGMFHLEVDGADLTGPVQVPDTGGEGLFRPITIEGLAIPAGDHQVRLVMDSPGPSGLVGSFDSFRLGSPPAPSAPFNGTPFNIGEVIEAEDYDSGGYGIAFGEHDFGADNAYRNDAVEVAADPDASNGWAVTLEREEWLTYRIRVDTAASYLLDIQGKGDGDVRAEVDGYDIGPAWTRADDAYADLSIFGGAFFADVGEHTLRIIGSWGMPVIDAIRLTLSPLQLDVALDSDGASALVDQPLAVQSDSRIITAGPQGLQRFNPDGTPSPITGDDPLPPLTTLLYGGTGTSHLAPLSDGSYLWLSRPVRWDENPRLYRFGASGSPDAAFGGQGFLEFERDDFDWVSMHQIAADLQDGRFYVAHVDPDPNRGEMLIDRYTASGQLDPSFSPVVQPLNELVVSVHHSIAGIVVQSSGKIVAAALAPANDFRDVYSIISRFDSTGAVDTTFGTAGSTVTLLIRYAGYDPLSLLHDDSLVVQYGGTFVTFDPEGTLVRRQESGEFPGTTIITPGGQVLFNRHYNNARLLHALELSSGSQQSWRIPLPLEILDFDGVKAMAVDGAGRLIAVAEFGTDSDTPLYRIFRFERLPSTSPPL